MSDLPTTPESLMATLDDLGIAYDLHHHEPVHTVAESAKLDIEIEGESCRNLFVRDKKQNMFLVTVSNNTKVDLKHLQNLLNCGRLSFGSPDRLWTYLGVRPGSVCPFAAINDTDHSVSIILDADMMKAARVNYHPLLNAMTISLTPADLLKFFAHTGHKPQILDLRS